MVKNDASKQIKDIAAKYADVVKDHIELHGLYLYGSYANGDFTKDSDIDIAVISNGFTGDLVEDTFKLMKFRRSVDHRIEPHPFNVEEFNEHAPIANEIISNGIRIV